MSSERGSTRLTLLIALPRRCNRLGQLRLGQLSLHQRIPDHLTRLHNNPLLLGALIKLEHISKHLAHLLRRGEDLILALALSGKMTSLSILSFLAGLEVASDGGFENGSGDNDLLAA